MAQQVKTSDGQSAERVGPAQAAKGTPQPKPDLSHVRISVQIAPGRAIVGLQALHCDPRVHRMPVMGVGDLQAVLAKVPEFLQQDMTHWGLHPTQPKHTRPAPQKSAPKSAAATSAKTVKGKGKPSAPAAPVQPVQQALF